MKNESNEPTHNPEVRKKARLVAPRSTSCGSKVGSTTPARNTHVATNLSPVSSRGGRGEGTNPLLMLKRSIMARKTRSELRCGSTEPRSRATLHMRNNGYALISDVLQAIERRTHNESRSSDRNRCQCSPVYNPKCVDLWESTTYPVPCGVDDEPEWDVQCVGAKFGNYPVGGTTSAGVDARDGRCHRGKHSDSDHVHLFLISPRF